MEIFGTLPWRDSTRSRLYFQRDNAFICSINDPLKSAVLEKLAPYVIAFGKAAKYVMPKRTGRARSDPSGDCRD